MPLYVANAECDECLFGPKRIVDTERKREILAECVARDIHFECHKGTIENKVIVCRGFYDRVSTQLIVIAQRLSQVQFVDTTDPEAIAALPDAEPTQEEAWDDDDTYNNDADNDPYWHK